MKFYTVDVMIPTYKPGQEFAELLPRLLEQTYPIRSIRVVNTGKKFWNPAWEQLSDKIMVEHIRPSEFDHGGTRRAMAESSDADLLLFMTQDAMPYDNACVEHLVEKFSLPHVKAAYARQLPRDDCRTLERFTRGFNYPEESDIKDAGDLPKLGVKTFFCSNVCAMYDRRTYEELGGFVESTLFNEDMIYAGKLIQMCRRAMRLPMRQMRRWYIPTITVVWHSFTAISTSVYPRHSIRRSLMRIRLRVRESVW